MSMPTADSVLAATHKLVQQAMTGQWHEVPKTLQERRLLLDRLAANAAPHDQQWLTALKQAMLESDAAVARMTAAGSSAARPPVESTPAAAAADVVGTVMDMIKGR